MKKLLLIMGDLATGKSTFANILSKRYDTNVFFKDSIKEVLGDTIGFSNREENKKLSNATMELMFFLFSEFGKLNKNLILESNFHTEELEMLKKLGLGLGGSLENVVVFDKDKILSVPRFDDELIRHKILDAIGDLYLLGHIKGHVVAVKTGHAFNAQIAKQIQAYRTKEEK